MTKIKNSAPSSAKIIYRSPALKKSGRSQSNLRRRRNRLRRARKKKRRSNSPKRNSLRRRKRKSQSIESRSSATARKSLRRRRAKNEGESSLLLLGNNKIGYDKILLVSSSKLARLSSCGSRSL